MTEHEMADWQAEIARGGSPRASVGLPRQPGATSQTTTPNVNPRTTIRRMAKPPMVQKTYRVPKALYEAAMEQAAKREENLSDVIREALERYVRRA